MPYKNQSRNPALISNLFFLLLQVVDSTPKINIPQKITNQSWRREIKGVCRTDQTQNYQNVTRIDARLRASLPLLIRQPLGEWLRVNDEEKELERTRTHTHAHSFTLCSLNTLTNGTFTACENSLDAATAVNSGALRKLLVFCTGRWRRKEQREKKTRFLAAPPTK